MEGGGRSNEDGEGRSQRTQEINRITEKIIGCAIEVHRVLGPGLFEASYEGALCLELDRSGIRFQRQVAVPLFYKGEPIGDYRLDLLVEDDVVVEVKAVERLDPIFDAQVLTYLRATGKPIGLLINFNSRMLKNGIKRFIL